MYSVKCKAGKVRNINRRKIHGITKRSHVGGIGELFATFFMPIKVTLMLSIGNCSTGETYSLV